MQWACHTMLLAADAVKIDVIELLIERGGHFTLICAAVYSEKL